MNPVGRRLFREVWLVDFEFCAATGENPIPICLVAWELGTGQKLRLWEEELRNLHAPPYPIDRDCLVVAYYASAEMGCHLALGWPLPTNLLDLYVEFRNLTNGRPTLCGAGLLGALAWFGLPAIEAAQKESMRALAERGGPWSDAEKAALLEYCESDVAALSRLLPVMEPYLDVERALNRGRYMRAAAHIEQCGVPIDMPMLARLREDWTHIQDRLIAEIDRDYGIYEGRTFKSERFAQWLVRNCIAWPRLASGALDLSDVTFREMSRAYPAVSALRELRVALSQMRLSELAVGSDGRNRTLLSAFRARTSRNQPSNSRFIFGPSVWLRSLIKPRPGFGLAYLDWSQQEFGIAAALSGDPLMQAAYLSGDPYLEFAKQAGAVPKEATRATHKAKREQFKACVLAVQYGMGAEALAVRINQPVIQARNLLRLHRETYRVFWQWSDAALTHAMLHGYLYTTFGWTIHVGPDANDRSLRNFPMQANGAEMLRLACCFAVESGIQVLAPVHDAILIEAPLADLDETVQRTQALMARASEIVLDGFSLRSDVKLVRYPERYLDERGVTMWETACQLLGPML
jgi:DNA polymerase-1